MDYLALRRHDIRHLQSELAALGLSSLGRTEPHVTELFARRILLKLAGAVSDLPTAKAVPQVGLENHLLDRNTEALFGEAPTDRHVRIMVTMPRKPRRSTNWFATFSPRAWTASGSTAPMTVPKPGQE